MPLTLHFLKKNQPSRTPLPFSTTLKGILANKSQIRPKPVIWKSSVAFLWTTFLVVHICSCHKAAMELRRRKLSYNSLTLILGITKSLYHSRDATCMSWLCLRVVTVCFQHKFCPFPYTKIRISVFYIFS